MRLPPNYSPMRYINVNTLEHLGTHLERVDGQLLPRQHYRAPFRIDTGDVIYRSTELRDAYIFHRVIRSESARAELAPHPGLRYRSKVVRQKVTSRSDIVELRKHLIELIILGETSPESQD